MDIYDILWYGLSWWQLVTWMRHGGDEPTYVPGMFVICGGVDIMD